MISGSEYVENISSTLSAKSALYNFSLPSHI